MFIKINSSEHKQSTPYINKDVIHQFDFYIKANR